ncbi:MAG: SusC/RagA family TonB-linked outer membrane protein [Gemmatimonadetes bacterium]|nr:SusC/RagA family TonB-linked outer membrane protein [Gemmatimonadota bacterium]
MRATDPLTKWLSVGLAALLMAAGPPLAAQQVGQVRGSVRAADGQPVQGAQVYVEGTRIGTTTNADGRYQIDRVPTGTQVIVAEMLGYRTGRQENILVSPDQTALADFQLETMALSLAEVVVTGVTEATSRARLPFTVATVTREDIPVAPKVAVGAIQGRVAGASIVNNPAPGGSASILLRTPTSINRENTPLIVVDGTILTANLLDISALDIESVEVVKGAAAASLYGSRAAAGVVQIRTARGSSLQEGRTRFTVRSEYGSSDVPHPIQWARFHNLQTNSNGKFLNAQGQVVPRHLAATTQFGFQDQPYPGQIYDHINSLFDPGTSATHYVTIGHNAGNTSWLASGSYQKTAGVVLDTDGYERADFRMNLDHRLRNDLSFSASLFHLRSTTDDMCSCDVFFDFIHQNPDVNILEPDPDGTKYAFQPDPGGIRANPLYRIVTQESETKRQRTLASLDLRYNPLSWVAFDVNASYDRSDRKFSDYVPRGAKTPDNPDGGPGSLAIASDLTNGINASAGMAVSRDFGDLRTRTTFRALLERDDEETLDANGDIFSVGGLPDLDALLVPEISSSETKVRSSGYFINVDTDWADKYFISGLVRRDGSSLFGPEERWHTYYRASGAYRMTAEPWWPFPAFDEFKVRYSRGTAGGRPNFADRYEVFTVLTGGGLELNTLGNQFLKPERSTEQEFGVDMVVLGRASLQLTYATQKTVDQLIAVPLPAIFGFGVQQQNAGTIEGHTYEATVEARLIESNDLRWSVNVVADRSRNKITEYDRPCHTADPGPSGRAIAWRCAGETLGILYGEKFITDVSELRPIHAASHDAFQVNDQGLLVPVGVGNTFRDGVAKSLWGTTVNIDGVNYAWGHPIRLVDENGVIKEVRIGDSNADLKWGISNNIQWKGFNLYALFDGQIGGDIYNATKQRMYQWFRNGEIDQVGKPDDLKKPQVYYSGALYNGNRDTSWFVEDASHVKLRELSLRYAFDASRFTALSRVGIDRAVVSLIGRNLKLWTDYTGYDPEIGDAITRIDDFDYPIYRTFTAMIEIQF